MPQEQKQVVIRTSVDDFGMITKIIQDSRGEFLSIDQEGEFIIILAQVPVASTFYLQEEIKSRNFFNLSLEIKQ